MKQGIILVFLALLLNWCGTPVDDKGLNANPSPTPDSSGSPSPTPTPDSSVSPSPSPSPGADIIGVAGSLAITTDITNIVVTPADAAGLASGIKASSFYSVNTSGQLGQLQIFTAAGSPLTEVDQGTARDFIQNDQFMFFVFTNSPVSNCKLVVRRKSDGKLFCGGSPDLSTTLNTGNRGAIQTDASGNIYFRESANPGQPSVLVKVNVENPDNPTKSTVHESNSTLDGISGFVVGPQGDVFVIIGSGSGSALIRKANGGIQNIAAASQVRAFVGSDGSFYWIKYGSTDITKLLRGSDGSFTSSVHASGAVSGQAANLDKAICSTQDDIFGGDIGAIPSANAYRFIQSPGSLDLAAQGYQSWSGINCATDRVYVLGTDSSGNGLIKSMTTSGNSWSTVVPAGDYTIFNFEANATGVVYFSGLRNSDGAKVLAKIASPGDVPTIISTSFFQAQKLVPLN